MLGTSAKGHRSEAGMSMIELMIAMVVLAIGMAGIMVVVTGAIASNSRNKLDTTATTLSEMVIERISNLNPNSTTAFTVTDCLNNTFTVDPTGAVSPGRGATLNASNEVSFTSLTSGTPATGYTMQYVTCGSGGAQTKYDIRWNITNFKTSGTAVVSKYVTVSARQVGGGSSGQLLKYFAPPVTLRTLVTN